MEQVLAALQRAPRAYLLHHLADADAVGSAVAMARRWPGMLAVRGAPSAAGERVAARFGATLQRDPDLAACKVAIAVDAGSPSVLPPIPAGLPVVVIDHHRPGGWEGIEVEARLVDPDATSTCEIVLRLLWALGEGLHPDEALALLCGLVADTQRFRFATADTLSSAFVLIENGADLREAIALLEEPSPEDRSERLARLKAGQRAEVEEVAGLLLARSRVNAFEASAASALVAAGADVALVAAQRGPQASVSARVRGAAEARVDAARVLQAAAKRLGPAWGGGGHAAAAGLNGPGTAEEALDAAARALHEALGAP